MQSEVTSVYVPIKTPDNKIWAIILSILVHVTIIGLVIFAHNHHKKSQPMETVLINPEQLADIMRQIKANQENQHLMSGDTLPNTDEIMTTITPTTSQPKTKATITSESKKTVNSNTQQAIDELAQRQEAWEKQQKAIAEQLDREAEAELQQYAKDQEQQQIEEIRKLERLKQTEKDSDEIAERLHQDSKKYQEKSSEKTEKHTSQAQINETFSADNTETNPTSSNGNLGGSNSNRVGGSSGGSSASFRQAIVSQIERNWHPPDNSSGQVLSATIKVAPNGQVTSIHINGTNDDVFANSLREAIQTASPLPVPSDASEYQKYASLRLSFKAK